jgi:hypothetical protein
MDSVMIGSRNARALRTFSRTTAWVAGLIFAVSFFASDKSPEGAVRFLGASFALFVFATAAYLVLLRVAQMAAGHELQQQLTSGQLLSDNSTPLILFLRSFDVAKSNLAQRLISVGMAVLSLATQHWEGATEHAARYDVDEKLDDAVGAHGRLVAIGNKQVSYGSAKLTVRDEDWKEVFHALADAARLIVMLPGPSASVLWEISQLVSQRSALARTVFVMPRDHPVGWSKTAELAATDLGVKLPAYKAKGCCFRIDVDDHSISAVELEAFTRALNAQLQAPQRRADRGLDVGELWRSARELGPETLSS